MEYRRLRKHVRFLRYFYIALGLCGLLVAALADSSRPTSAAFKAPVQERTEQTSGLPKHDIRLAGKDGFEDFDLTSNPGRQRAQQNAQARARLTAVDEFLKNTRLEPGQNLRAIANEAGAMKNFFIEGGTLSGPQADTPDNIARNFLARHHDLFALKAADLSNLKLMNEDEDEGTVFLEYAQTRGGVKVFEAPIQVVVLQSGEVLSVREGFLVGDQQVRLRPTLNEAQGIAKAFEHAGRTVSPSFVETHTRGSQSEMSRFANPLDLRFEEVLSELNLVRIGNTARLAWHVYADVGPEEWYELLVDAHTGELLLRHNLYVFEAQGTVYTKSPNNAVRQLVSFVGNPTINCGGSWMGTSIRSISNNVDAYLDTDGNDAADLIDGPGLRSGRAYAPDQNFTFPFSTTVDPRTQQAAVVTNLFYFNNVMHDFSYKLGFDEASRNFQTVNCTGSGADIDAVMAEAQDGAQNRTLKGRANFATPPDGIRPRMQMGIFISPTPSPEPSPEQDRDSSLDSDVVFHEYGHGISNRLIGNGGAALSGLQSGALGEGWSDYWAATINGDGAMGEYVTNTSKGVRRAKYAVPADPLHDSYADVGAGGFEVHRDGEVWAATLWDLRMQLGATFTNKLVLRGMKHTPIRPSFLNARDGILQADQSVNAGANRCSIWKVFARHGMGFSAVGNDGTTRVASTDLPPECMPPVYEGELEAADCGLVWGWAWDKNKPDDPITVEIYDGPTRIDTVPANLFRKDLLIAGKGNGFHAFVFNVPDSLKDGQSHSIGVKFPGTSTFLVGSTKSIICGASLFPTAVPQTTASAEGKTWEQGVEFSSNVDGTITHIRFWRAADEPMGGHVGTIWTAEGAYVRSESFNETPGSGWQYATLSPALQISAGVRYKVTYNARNSVAKTFNVFGSVTSGPLTGWGSSYTTPAGFFPTTGSTSNLFADIVFNSPR